MFVINEFRKVASKNKETIALSFAGTEMCFEELLNRVDGLAAKLQTLNIGLGQRVAITLPRSFEMIIALLGTLAAGATYIPLDLDNPSARSAALLVDCQPDLILCNKEDADLPLFTAYKCLSAADWPQQGQIKKEQEGENAYIIYTSGSTGKPKGVEVGHRALENYIKWAMDYLPFTGGGVPLFTSSSFDHAITNIFPPLLKGEKIVLLPSIREGRDLAACLIPGNGNVYSYVKITPSLFAFLNIEQRAALGCCTGLLLFGGERLDPALIAEARRANSGLAVMNHYGPTEATVGCCVYTVPVNFDADTVPIGKPIPGALITIRREDSVAPAFEKGELCIGGLALANGYWHKEDLTKKFFVDFPDDTGSEKRWYKTGDRVSMDPDGNLVYAGRVDDQVKILGNRVEPAEIQLQLNGFPGINQSVVFSCNRTTAPVLAAAMTFFGEGPSVIAIRQYLQGLLPPAMIPVHYLILEELPLGPGGKADIQKLHSLIPTPENNGSIEERVTEKFREIVGLDEIALEDDYFVMGGDSLGTAEIAAWASEQYNIPVEISAVFEFPTVALLSRHIRDLLNDT